MILPSFRHKKASSVFKNLQKEVKGIETNEYLYQLVQKIKLQSSSLNSCYLELAQKIKFPSEDYFRYLKKSMMIWGKLFNS